LAYSIYDPLNLKTAI